MVQPTLFELAYVFIPVLLETKTHGYQGRRTWFNNNFKPIVHDSIITCLWFMLQVFGILATFIIIEY
jgi:hypothetical protein